MYRNICVRNVEQFFWRFVCAINGFRDFRSLSINLSRSLFISSTLSLSLSFSYFFSFPCPFFRFLLLSSSLFHSLSFFHFPSFSFATSYPISFSPPPTLRFFHFFIFFFFSFTHHFSRMLGFTSHLAAFRRDPLKSAIRSFLLAKSLTSYRFSEYE